jgi:hypothetical protein
MTVSCSPTGQCLDEDIRLDFDLVCAELDLAKQAVRTKDTPAARARLRACRDRVDAILDMRNDAARSRA